MIQPSPSIAARGHARIVCFGEVLARLSTRERGELAFAETLDLHIGGAEANVAAALAWLGHNAEMVTTLPVGPLGDRALVHLRARGVQCDAIQRVDGRLGLYFVASGASLRPSTIVYDRAGSAFAMTGWSRFDWDAALLGADLLHLSGISLAVGARSSEAVSAAMAAARRRSVLVAFDANNRSQLWRDRGDDPVPLISAALAQADLFFGDHRDATLVLGRSFDTGPNRPRAAALALLGAFPNLQIVASTARQVDSVDRHVLSARIDTREAGFATTPQAIEGIVDRIGGGDAFAAGVLHGLLTGQSAAHSAETGLALACLKHSQTGDAAAVDRSQLEAFSTGDLDIRR